MRKQSEAFVTLYQVAFTPAQKQYRIGLQFTHKNGDFGAISVMERSWVAPIAKVESHISDRCSYYTEKLLLLARSTTRYSENIAFIHTAEKAILPQCVACEQALHLGDIVKSRRA